jgi:hypothetical protein
MFMRDFKEQELARQRQMAKRSTILKEDNVLGPEVRGRYICHEPRTSRR